MSTSIDIDPNGPETGTVYSKPGRNFDVPMIYTDYKNNNAEEFDIITAVFFPELVQDRINKQMGLAQVEIFDLLLDRMVLAVPYDTRPDRPTYKLHLRDAIIMNSMIEGNNVIVGSGSDIDYAFWLNHGFAEKLGASMVNPAKTWFMKDLRRKSNNFDDPLSMTPYLYTTAYRSLKDIVRIIIKHVKIAMEGFDFVESVSIGGGSVDEVMENINWSERGMNSLR